MRRQAFFPLVTYPEPNSDSATANAVAMAALLDADLHVLALNADIPTVSNALSRLLLDVPHMIREAETLSRTRGEHLCAQLAEQAQRAGVAATTNTVALAPTLLADAAAVHARYHDVVLLGWEAENQTSRMTAEAVVFGSGRPTILLPESPPAASLDHVAIAWDGSRVAARAVADAGWLLDRAANISILTIFDEKPLAELDIGERLAAGLRRRGLPATAASIGSAGRSIATALQDEEIERGAGLLVMGGYGHSRMRDFVLGGATEGILRDLRLPVLLSH